MEIMDTAVMIDGAFIRKKFRSAKRRDISAPEIQQFVINTLGILNIPDRNYRVYFYDCKPCSERTSLPITHGAYNFDANPQYGMNPLTDSCFIPNLKQKGVDIKIGLDVAWVSFNRIASSIIFISRRGSGRGLIQSGKTC
ncbi:hypothetical protein AGMMS49546_35390 [Spirochaetia bacterium]|nr:hypothetical protein AGMMS49546_35390 [Spirochaetia bacterium]